MKRAFYLFAAVFIGATAVLLVAGWWHELQQADGRATQHMRENHPGVAHAAKDLGDKVRRLEEKLQIANQPLQIANCKLTRGTLRRP